MKWTGTLEHDASDKSYSGVVLVWGFPYRITVRRGDGPGAPTLVATIEDGEAKR